METEKNSNGFYARGLRDGDEGLRSFQGACAGLFTCQVLLSG